MMWRWFGSYFLWTKKKITNFEDLKGMKVGAVGSNIPWVTAAGATPVTIKGLATMYNSMKTGIFEGVAESFIERDVVVCWASRTAR